MHIVPADDMATALSRPSGGEAPALDSSVASAGVVHDLGNLIQLATSAIGIVGRSPDLQGSNLSSVIDGASSALERAGALVRDALGKIRDQPEAPRVANPSDCLAEIEAQMRTTMRSGIELVIRLDPGLPHISCDPLGLQSAVLNLLFNACEAMTGSGLILVTGRRSGEEMVEIRVADDGIGMSAETVVRALDPFFTTKCDGLGGIGLPMVERFARASGGTLVLESTAGIGTTAILRLPAVPEVA